MADTSALGADARKGVEVRVLFSACFFEVLFKNMAITVF